MKNIFCKNFENLFQAGQRFLIFTSILLLILPITGSLISTGLNIELTLAMIILLMTLREGK
ncbi:MAG: hypothetical protein EA390_06280 [Balneolaceae bacterium]|nr:MAG: hypothetical protein EA390_06280 [Balneolaceae bacterium]